VGAVLSTLNVLLGPAAGAVLPAVSDAVLAAIEIPSVPSPVILEIVTVRVVLPVPVTATVPLAVPVLFSVTLPATSVTVSAPVYVIVYVIGPLFVNDADGAPILTVGGTPS